MKVSQAMVVRFLTALALVCLAGPGVALQGVSAARSAVTAQVPSLASLSQPTVVNLRALPGKLPAALLQAQTSQALPSTAKARSGSSRSLDQAGFREVAAHGFDDPANGYAWTMAWFNHKLYVGTSRNNLCNAKIVQVSPWTQHITGCLVQSQYLNLDMRAQVWAYTPSTATWQRVYRSPMVNQTINGHEERLAQDAGYRSMAVYTDKHGVTALYVGTTGFGDLGYILRTVDGVHFERLGPAGFNIFATTIRALTPFAGKLFAAPIGQGPYYLQGASRDKVYMTDDPASGKWTAVSRTGFGDDANSQIYTMQVFNGQLYVDMSNTHGFQLWRTTQGGNVTPNTWTAVLVNGADRGSDDPTVTAMTVFHNTLYVGTAATTLGPGGSPSKPCELIAVHADDSWDLVMGDARQTDEGFKAPVSHYSSGFGNHFNIYLWNLAVHDGWLYAGTYNYATFRLAPGLHDSSARRIAGFDLWRSNDGVHWEKVSANGFGNPFNYGVRTMVETPLGMFLGTANPFAAAPGGLGGAEIWLLPSAGGLSYPHGVTLDTSACPMAHCSPSLDGNQRLSIPTNGASPSWLYSQKGVVFSVALGCATGLHLIVCAGTKDPHSGSLTSYDNTYVQALDFAGHPLWNSRNLLDAEVGGGVPLLDGADNSYVSDNNWIMSFTSEGVVRWQVPNPAKAVLVSMNMVSSGYLVGQAGLGYPGSHGLILAINPQTGAIAGSVDLVDTVNGVSGEWGTAKTVSVVGNRIYTVTEFVPAAPGTDPLHHARLYAIDVDAGGGLHVAWHLDFEGPSGASPLAVPGPHTTIYFGGTGLHAGDPQHTTLFAVEDDGSFGRVIWNDDLYTLYGVPYSTSSPAPGLQTAPVHDPRGGIWVWAEFDKRLFHFDERTGQGIESLDMPTLAGDPAAYPTGTMEIVTNGGTPILLVGDLGGAQNFDKVVAINLATHAAIWSPILGSGPNSAPYGLYPLASTSGGSTVLVVPTADGVVHGYTLN